MARYKPDKFNFSQMSERMTFQLQNPDGTFTDDKKVWAHALKDGFTRSETDNWYKVMVREQRALESLLSVGNRLKWRNKILSIFSWQDPSYEDHIGFIEVLTKQVATLGAPSPSDNDLFRDIVAVYNVAKVEVNRYGLISYEYRYDFTTPNYTDIKCFFMGDRNRYLDDKKEDVEHDSLIVKFNADAPVKIEDYIISPVHGKFKVDMVVKDENNMLLAYVNRTEVQ